MRNPTISVVMSVYNGEKYLKTSIESILSQTFSDLEFIIINDGSTDNTSQILEEYRKQDSRIEIIHQENMGLTKSLNKAINLAQGEYIARQDADDISLPNRFENQIKTFIENPDLDLVASWYYVIDEEGEIIVERKLPNPKVLKKLLPYENLICHSSVLFKKSKYLEFGKYNENIRYGQDRYLWMKMKNIEIIPESLIKYRWNIYNITHKRFKEKININDYGLDKRMISTLLIQQKEFEKARSLLKNNLTNPRNIFYYLLTFLPPWVVDIYMWHIRYYLRSIFSLIFPYYKIYIRK